MADDMTEETATTPTCSRCGKERATHFYALNGKAGQACDKCFAKEFGFETRKASLRRRARGG